jgi:hypothetical protein
MSSEATGWVVLFGARIGEGECAGRHGMFGEAEGVWFGKADRIDLSGG